MWVIGVILAGTKEVEDYDDVEGKHGNRQVPVVQHRRQTTVKEYTREKKGDERIDAAMSYNKHVVHKEIFSTLESISQVLH